MNIQDKIRIFRERWYGRQDTYGKRWVSTRPDGSQGSGYAPVCENIWKDFCHIKLKDNVPCGSCTHKKLSPVSDKAVLQHVKGEEAMLCYLLQTDGTVKFAAWDFDMKPGKEDKGYTFADVKEVSELLTEWGIPHGVARSTGKGYHLYLFFEDFYPANKFRAIVMEIYDRVGFMEYLRQGIKPIPEYFPKQSHVGKDGGNYGHGNGIKPPMVEPNFAKGRNCFVDANDVPIGEGLPPVEQAEAQWRYLDSIPLVKTAQMDGIIEKYEIVVTEDAAPPSGIGRPGSMSGSRTTKWQPPLNGSIEKVLEGCAALRGVKDRVLKGEILGHHEGYALFHMCMATLDGLDWFKANVKGWGETETQIKQLEHSVGKNYSPWTCFKMQENSICPVNTRCFEKKPPREIVDGREVVRDDLPREQWPEPSPIRYAYGKGEDFLLKLQQEASELSQVEDNDVRIEALKALALRAQVFDDEQQKAFKEHVKSLKIARKNELAKVFAKAASEHQKKVDEKAAARSDTIWVDDNCYMKLDFGYSHVKKSKGGETKTTRLCDVDIDVTEERLYTDEEGILRAVFRGTAKHKGVTKDFELDTDTWTENAKFHNYFAKLLGSGFIPLRQNVEMLKQAAMAFSREKGIDKTVYRTTHGFYGDTYFMPSVIVDKEGVRPNTSAHVDLSAKSYARFLDFSILTDDEFRETLLHIKSDFLQAWPELWTYTGLAHALFPPVSRLLGWDKKHTLFYEGLTGAGKTELTHCLQYFWGNFVSLPNLLASGVAVLDTSYDFKDSCVVFDDYKGLTKQQTSTVIQAIQYSYDGSGTPKLNRDGTQRKMRNSRALFLMSGEEFPAGQASTVARCILIEVEKQDTRITQAKYLRVKQARKHYRGVTPRFISWVLSKDGDELSAQLNEQILTLKDRYPHRQNVDRVSQNLALNFMTWKLWVEFMLVNNAVSDAEAKELCDKHLEHVFTIMDAMIIRCGEEQSSQAFASTLQQMLSTGELFIAGHQGRSEGKFMIGYIPNPDEPDIAYIYPAVVYQKVKDYMRNAAPITGTERSIGRQLVEGGFIIQYDKGRNQKLVRRADNSREYVWVIDLKKLGFGTAKKPETSGSDGKRSGVVLEFRPGAESVKDSDGLF